MEDIDIFVEWENLDTNEFFGCCYPDGYHEFYEDDETEDYEEEEG